MCPMLGRPLIQLLLICTLVYNTAEFAQGPLTLGKTGTTGALSTLPSMRSGHLPKAGQP